ncbi:hypothetical protein Q9S36_43490 [Microbacterium sp. ARD31]|uniref:hypothetical protein n=1 Tax=Microbacterium sp. ARD31 TaxID=2962576 RepID=UPI00288204EC|nr:hypothetical protein [Microbacterium sp. ARD31]MDT0187071.1 hypothetical protein [Microbacterium sp. ARD31]
MPGVRRLRRAARPWPRIAAALSLVAVSLAATVLVPAAPADAAVVRPFTKVFSKQANGSIQITGNALMTCGTSTSCLQAQDGSVSASNNSFDMRFLDVDSDPTTSRSSSANLTIPSGARVLYAGLFWGAARAAGTDGVDASGPVDTIRFRAPGSSGYSTLTATRTDYQSSSVTYDYSAYRDVTALVQGAGAGTYWGADVAAATGVDRYAGWSLVVALEDPAAPLRDLTVFNGYATVIKNEIVDTTISGFLTPLSGAVDAKFGMVTYEGDNSLTGDYFQVGTTRLADALSPSANFFTSRVSAGGTSTTNRTPNAVNTLGLDAKVVDAPGVVRNGATATNVRFATNGDFYYPAALTTQIDLYAPTIQGSTTVTNLSGSSPARVGDVLEYSLTFSNTGEDAAVRSVVANALPPGTTYVPGSLRYTAGAGQGTKTDAVGDDQAEYDAATRTVRARIGRDATAATGGSLVSSNTATVVFRVRVDPTAAGTTLRSTATLDYRAQTINRDYTYQTAEVATPVAEEADVSITKTASADPVTAGGQVTYTLTARNAGPSTASGVQVVDTLPSGVTYVSSSPSTGSCSAASGTLTCNLANLPSGGTATVSVVVRVPADSTATSVTNVARVTSTTSDPDPGNNNASVSTGVVRQADVALTASASPAAPVPGTDVTYTLVATNKGASRAGTVRISDTLPSALVVTSATTDQGSCTVTGSQVVCSAGALDPGQSVQVTLVARVPSSAGGASLVNTASVASSTTDPVPGNNVASSTVTPAAPSADVTVATRTTTSPVVAGRPVQYVVTVGNDGPSDAAGVTLGDQLPAGITGIAASTTAGSCTVSGSAVDCALGTIAAGRSVQVTIDGLLAAGATGTLANSATATTTTADPAPGNDTGTSSVAIDTLADLAVTTSADPVVDGNVATYTIVVTNNGPSTARSVKVTDPVPAPLTYVGATTDRGTCAAAGDPATVTCDVGDLAVGASATVTVQAQTPADGTARGTSNTATVTSPTNDPVPGNNSATHVLPTASQADLSLTKTATPNPVVAGGTVTWRLTARNNGPSVASTVTIDDVVPARVTDVTATTTTPGADCAPVAGNEVTCTVDSLSPGSDFVVEVTGTVVPGSARGVLANSATVQAATPVDPSTGNNTSSASTEVVARADLVVTKTGPVTATAGTTASWDVTVRNDGPSTATDVRLVDNVPSGVTVVGSSTAPAGVTCSVVDGALTCPVGSLAPGEELTVTVDGRISSSLPDGTTLLNSAAASSGTPDPSPGTNSDAHTTTVVERSSVRLSKASDPATLVPGTESSYLLTVTNDGPSDARDVVVTDDLDADLTVVDADIPGGTCDVAGQLVTCRLAVLPADATTVARIRVRVAPDRRTPIANSASVATPSDDTPADDAASVTSDVEPHADLQVVESVSKDRVAAGEGLTYTLTVVNNGPSTADDATIEDTFPAGVVPSAVTTTAGTCTTGGQLLHCDLGQVLPGTPVVVTVDASTTPDASPGTSADTAVVGSPTADAAHGNNTSQAPVEVVARADVQVTTTADSSSFVPGRPVSWTILFNNAGPSTARDVVVTDTLPDAVTITSAVHGTGSPCTVTGQQVSCALGDRAPGQRVIKVVGTLASAYAGSTLATTGRVTTTTSDPTPVNDASTATTPISRLTDLEIIETVSPANPVAGQRVTFTMSVHNNGPSDAINPQLIDQLPSGLTDVVVNRPTLLGTPATAECELRAPTDPGTADNPAAPTVFCNGPVFRAGLPARVIGSVEATVAPGFTGSLVNTGRISSDTIDVVASNNEAVVTTEVGAVADVSITKTLTPAVPAPGEAATWALTVHNDGPSVARDVVVRDDVHDAVTGLTAATDTGSCAVAAGNDVGCSLGDLPPGATVVITLTGGVPAAFTGDLDNTATVASPTDVTPANNTATVSSSPTPDAQVSITKSLSPAAPVPGRDVTWTVVVTNAGPSVAHDVVVRDDVLDAISGLTAAADTGSCAVAGGNDVTCALGDLPPGTSMTLTLTGGLPPGFTGTLGNTATVTSPDDSTPLDNVATASATAAPDGAVAVTKTVQPSIPVPGRPVTWTVTVTGTGPSTARDVVVRDDVVDAVTGLAATTDAGSCAVAPGNDVTCPVGDLAPGQRAVVTLTGGVPASWAGSLSNTATVSSPTDSSPADNTATVDPATAPGADLSIVTTATPAVAVPGQDVTWTLTVTNTGPSVARDVLVLDDVVDGLGDVVASPACTVAAGNEVACGLGDLGVTGADASRTLTITGRVPADHTGRLANTATVASATHDSHLDDNTSTTTGTTQPVAGVSITATASPVHPVPGRDATWTLRVTNAGPSVARAVHVVDDVVSALTGVTASTGRSPEPCTVAAGNVVGCDLGDLASGETVTITVTGGVPASYTGRVDNTATVGSPTDSTPADNTATTSGTAAPQAELSITNALTPSRPVPGEAVAWRLTVVNAGPSTARGVTVSDDVPAAVTALIVEAAGDACTVAAGDAVSCDLGDLGPGESRTVTLRGTLAADFTGTLSTTATVGSPTDTTPADNSATATGESAPVADLAVSARMSPQKPVAGAPVDVTVQVTNHGPSTARQVELVHDLPPALGQTTASVTGGGTCAVDGRWVTCDVPTLASGSSATVTLRALVDPSWTGEVTAVTTAGATTSDPDPSNNSARVSESGTGSCAPVPTSGRVVTCADLGLAKTVAPRSAGVGQLVTYTLTVTNAGPSSATDVAVVDELDDDLVVVSVDVTSGRARVTTDERTVTAVFNSVRPHTEGVVRIVARVSDDATGAVPNTARATAGGEKVGTGPGTTVQDTADVEVLGVEVTGDDPGDGDDPDGPGGPDGPEGDGVLPDTGLAGPVAPLAALSAPLLVAGAWLVPRSRVRGGRHRGRHV